MSVLHCMVIMIGMEDQDLVIIEAIHIIAEDLAPDQMKEEMGVDIESKIKKTELKVGIVKIEVEVDTEKKDLEVRTEITEMEVRTEITEMEVRTEITDLEVRTKIADQEKERTLKIKLLKKVPIEHQDKPFSLLKILMYF